MVLVVSVGAGEHQLPLIRRLKALGHTVAAFAQDDGPGLAVADHQARISTHDHERAIAWIRTLGRPAAIGCFSYGRAVETALHLVAAFGLPGAIRAQTLAAIRSDDRTAHRSWLASLGLATPRTLRPGDLAGYGSDVVAKPRHGSGSSRGVRRLSAAAAASLDPEAHVFEESIPGAEHRIAAWVHGGLPVWVGVLQRWNLAGTCLAARYLALPDPPAWALALASRIGTAVGMDSGLLKIDLVLNREVPVVIEIDLGLSGDHLEPALAPAAWSLDLVTAYIDLILGRRPTLVPRATGRSCLDYLYREDPGLDQDRELVRRLVDPDATVAWRNARPVPCPPVDQRDAIAAVLHNAVHLPPGLPGRSRP